MFSWLKSIIRGRSVPAGGALSAPPTHITQIPQTAQSEPADSQFESIWSLLSISQDQEFRSFPEGLKPLADSVLTHFIRNKPAPSSFPTLAVRVMDLVSKPDVEIHELLNTISPDPAISAHLMRVANSALYHRGQDVLDLRTAVMKIGVRGVGEIAAGVAGRSLFDVSVRVEYETFPERWHELFHTTMVTAFAASQFAFEQHHGRPDRVFLGGMFVDIGKTLALRSLARLIIAGQVPLDLPESHVDALLEEVHSEIGTEALRLWGLPPHLVDLCHRHHEHAVEDTEDTLEIHALRLVDGVCRLVRAPLDFNYLDQTRQSLKALHTDHVRLRMLHRAVLEQQARVAVMFPG